MSPLHDDYKSEKYLKDIALNIAPALTSILNEVEHERYGFIFFVFDLKEGLMQYISDCNPEEALKTIEMWCVRRKMDLENAKSQNNADRSEP